MPRSYPPKSAGSYGLSDIARHPSRLGQIPRQGGLGLSATAVSWWRFFSLRRRVRMLDIRGLTLVRSAEPSGQRFGGTIVMPPGVPVTKASNKHL